MATLHTVDPEKFIKVDSQIPAVGRGAWTKKGIDFEYRYCLSKDPAQRLGTRAEVSLDHWAASAGSYAVQLRLMELRLLEPLADSERGIFGPKTVEAVKRFQDENKDPDGGAKLTVDGIVGTSDARALFTTLVIRAQNRYAIPDNFLLGETNHESSMDPGAVGYYIFYPDYRGVDRGMSQINSKFNPQVSWVDAFNPEFATDWSAARLRSFFDKYKKSNPKQSERVLWESAICAHNNPSAAGKWASSGVPPTEAAAKYVASVMNAIY